MANGQDPMVPVLNQLIPDILVTPGGEREEFLLSDHFGMEEVRDQAVRLRAEWTLIDGSEKTAEIDFLLFENRTPITVSNFLGYVERGDYQDMFIHRLVPGFVIQGGGFSVTTGAGGGPALGTVPTQAMIQNEFGVSNTLGTISMAKQGGDPNSATSQWFISTGANSNNLDFQNGGFTVFGRVSKESFEAALALDRGDDFTIFDLSSGNPSSPLGSTPLVTGTTNPTFVTERFYRFESVSEIPLPAGQATTDPDLVFDFEGDVTGGGSGIRVEDGELVVEHVPGELSSRKEVVLRAIDAVGNEVVDTFEVKVEADYETWRGQVFGPAEAADDAVSGPEADPNGDGVNNLTLFAQGLPVGAPVVVKSPEIVSAGSFVELEIETPYRAGLNLILEVSDGLGPWADLAATRSSRPDFLTKTEVFRVFRSVPDNPKSFYRIRYTLD